MGVDRRRFVGGAVGIGSAAVLIGGLGRILQRQSEVVGEREDLVLPDPDSPSSPLPADADLAVEGLDPFVTPNADFYRIDTALVVPQVSKDSWSLKIGGMVDDPIELSFSDLLSRTQVERYITLSCVSNPIGGDLIGNALWQGVLLKDVLEEAGVQPGATQVVSRSIDGWTAGTPTEVIMDGRDAILAIAMNGEPLPARHGYPVRMVVPGLYGYVSATKWVTEIELTRWEDYDAYWVPRGWSKEGPIKTMARIDTDRPAPGAGERVVAGIAWAIHRGVSRVQVRVDGGEWTEAELGGVPSNDTWAQWKATVDTRAGSAHGRGPRVRRRRRPADRGDRSRRPERGPGVPPPLDRHLIPALPTPEMARWDCAERNRSGIFRNGVGSVRPGDSYWSESALDSRALISSSKDFWKLETPSRSS
jgi:DMSO/TMAO reductase YedYZ molybdopterin-dependent catalytic subunit